MTYLIADRHTTNLSLQTPKACVGLFDRAVRGHITGKVMLKQISDRSEGTSNMDIRARMFPVERTANAMGPCRALPECFKNRKVRCQTSK